MKNIFLLLMLCLAGKASAQSYAASPGLTDVIHFNLNIKSPGVADFVKYGNTPVNLYLGQTNVTVPIYSADVPGERPISVSIGYNSEGFKPMKRSGLVGLNWYLNAGGSITREVRGMPDDKEGNPTTLIAPGVDPFPNFTNGFKVGLNDQVHTPSNIWSNPLSQGYVSNSLEYFLYGDAVANASSNKNYECTPDIFNFNFNGISGKFFFDNSGQVRIITNEPNDLKIDFSGFAEQPKVATCKPVNSQIVITDNQGNMYYFGGASKNLEYTIPIGTSNTTGSSNQVPNNFKYPTITTWHLWKIKYYNGDEVLFNYRDDSALSTTFCNSTNINNFPSYPTNDPDTPNLRDFVVLHEYVSYQKNMQSGSGSIPGTGFNSGSSNIGKTYELQKIAILDNITGPNFEIRFTYSRQQYVFNTRTSGSLSGLFSEFKDLKLEKVQLYAGSYKVGEKSFNYFYYGGNANKRMFLSSVDEENGKPYSFEYDLSQANMPMPITFGIDHWGYWNGKHETLNLLIPVVNYDIANGTYDFATTTNGQTRDPDCTFAKVGLLTKITYPTKGFTTFEYEANTYRKRLEFDPATGVPGLVDMGVNKIGGGARIRFVKDYDGISSDTIVKEYKYNNHKNPSSSPGGVLLQWPRYVSYWKTNVGSNVTHYGFMRSSGIGRNIFDSNTFTYPEVSEVTTTNGYTVNTFTSFLDHPDTDSSVWSLYNVSNPPLTPVGVAKNYIGYYLNDRSIERGKLSSQIVYDASGNKVTETQNVYNDSSTRFDNFAVSNHLTSWWHQFNKMYYYQDYLTKTTKTDYFDAGANSIQTVTELSYDAYNNLLIQKMSTSVAGENLETRFTYPNPAAAPYSTDHRYGFPLTKSLYKGGVKLATAEFEYQKNTATSNLLLPTKVSTTKFDSNGTTPIGTASELRLEYTKYDSKGNPVEVKKDGVPTVYFWAYNKQLPIAEIKNATFAEVQSALGMSESAALAIPEGQLFQIENLRNNPALQKAMITTYRHGIHRGLTAISDPKAHTKSFLYDLLRRVKYVLDTSNGHTLEEYIYHFKN